MIERPETKYAAFEPIPNEERQWPSRRIEAPPSWCSVDLRDGNQALVEPMGFERKRRLFEALVAMGFREIEVGFPAAAEVEFDFVRRLIQEDRVPDDVWIQVLTQARDELIDRTMDSLVGSGRAILHLYNSTSTLQRRVVFGVDRAGCRQIAVDGARRVKARARDMDDDIVLEYSPESFTGTELDFAVEICEAVMDVWQPTPERPMILNLPATVEMATPNVFADQIEVFGRRIQGRDCVRLSVHPHNDRGTAVAAAELAVMAGADRVEGTLFGNGERTGNVDIVTLALNLYSQGVDPGLVIDDIDELVRLATHCTRLPVHPRHPYAGELVYTAFSGSHQDAIKKGFAAMAESGQRDWAVPYLPIDPADLGRSYEAVVRINSQSGKGGVAYVMEAESGLRLPRGLQIALSKRVQAEAEAQEAELGFAEIDAIFRAAFVDVEGPVAFEGYESRAEAGGECVLSSHVRVDGVATRWEGRGHGPLEAFVAALNRELGAGVRVVDYHEHGLGEGADAVAVAYVAIRDGSGETRWGVARDANIVSATLEAVVVAVNAARAAQPKGDAEPAAA
ncbi:MAG: 2-isopropylmalate synthase [Myxococcota bacterium]|nr:2-isopropylmalate synthase [Myxococcota bacterium]